VTGSSTEKEKRYRRSEPGRVGTRSRTREGDGTMIREMQYMDHSSRAMDLAEKMAERRNH
jgi:hypothetical protein